MGVPEPLSSKGIYYSNSIQGGMVTPDHANIKLAKYEKQI
jgi:hypothetical protein